MSQSVKENKPICLFTNFWDAEMLLKRKYFSIVVNKSEKSKIFMFNLIDGHYAISSIALSKPKMPNKIWEGVDLNTIHELCPTYKILMDYKRDINDSTWNVFETEYKALLKDRKDKIKKWIDSLKNDHIYILCCWENTKNGAHCHRRILFDAFSKSEYMKNKVISMYRN